MPDLSVLSEREIEILCLLAKGKSNKEIAQELFISVNTVKVHLRNVFAKIEVSSRTEATLYAVRAGLVDGVAETGANSVPEADVQEAKVEYRENSDSESLLTPPQIIMSPTPKWWQHPWIFAGVIVMFLFVGVGLSRFIPPASTPTPEAIATFAENQWQTEAPLPIPRFGQATTVYENQVYLIGGESTEGVTASAERYTPETNEWETLPPKPNAVTDVQAAVLGGQIYVPGGREDSGKITDVLEIFDPEKKQWTTGPTLPIKISAYALVAFEGKLYLFGGWDGTQYSDKVYVYSPDLEQWSQHGTLPSPRAFLSAVVAGNKIYVIGGYDGKTSLASNLIYTPEVEPEQDPTWEDATPLPAGRFAMGVVFIADNIYVLSGKQEGEIPENQLIFHPDTNQWSVGTVLTSSANPTWSQIGVAVVKTRVYAMGGLIDGIPTSQNLSFQVLYTVPLPVIIKP
ncbi:MAG: hypothetical protein H6636_09250 [Anaerolineales bacterium]|nr:hypothetical protein [Anaerolineales bacterium]